MKTKKVDLVDYLYNLSENIDVEYLKELEKYNPNTKKVKAKDMCAILMARGLITKGKIWWYSWENIGLHYEFFGSHKVPARMSDLSVKHHEYFESRKIGKYTVYRIKFENIPTEVLQSMTLNTFKVEDLYK